MARSRRPQQSSVSDEPRKARTKAHGAPAGKPAEKPGGESRAAAKAAVRHEDEAVSDEPLRDTPARGRVTSPPRRRSGWICPSLSVHGRGLVAPVVLTVAPGRDYELLDSGDGEKLERYGPLRVRRPENQAIWPKRLPRGDWETADAVVFRRRRGRGSRPLAVSERAARRDLAARP